MPEVWEWTAIDAAGKQKTYQTAGPDVPESSMLAHLRRHYRNLTITSIRRIGPREIKPATGIVEAHTYQFGILDEVKRELGLLPPERREALWQKLIQIPPTERSRSRRDTARISRRSILTRHSPPSP